MTPLVVKGIWSNDIFGWEEFLRYVPADPYDEFQAFGVIVGTDDEEGGTAFQVYVTTPTAFGRLKDLDRRPHAIVVDEFTPEKVIAVIEKTVAEASGLTYQGGIDRLRKIMSWEYEGM